MFLPKIPFLLENKAIFSSCSDQLPGGRGSNVCINNKRQDEDKLWQKEIDCLFDADQGACSSLRPRRQASNSSSTAGAGSTSSTASAGSTGSTGSTSTTGSTSSGGQSSASTQAPSGGSVPPQASPKPSEASSGQGKSKSTSQDDKGQAQLGGQEQANIQPPAGQDQSGGQGQPQGQAPSAKGQSSFSAPGSSGQGQGLDAVQPRPRVVEAHDNLRLEILRPYHACMRPCLLQKEQEQKEARGAFASIEDCKQSLQ